MSIKDMSKIQPFSVNPDETDVKKESKIIRATNVFTSNLPAGSRGNFIFRLLTIKRSIFRGAVKLKIEHIPSEYGRIPSDPAFCWDSAPESRFGTFNGRPIVKYRLTAQGILAMTELQGQIGIPTLLGYKKYDHLYTTVLYKYTEEPSRPLTVRAKAVQLFSILHNLHRQGVVNNTLKSIQWDEDRLILISWRSCKFRSNCCDMFNYANDDLFELSQPYREVCRAGNILKEWAEAENCLHEFNDVIEALTFANPFARITAAQALAMLKGEPVQPLTCINRDSIFTRYWYQLVVEQFIESFEQELKMHACHDVSTYEGCQWLYEAASKPNTTLKFGTREGKNVVAKVMYDRPIVIAKEFYVTQKMSGVSKHFPTVISASTLRLEGETESGFIMVMPEYRATSRNNNVEKTFRELVEVLLTLQRYGLVHADIAPQNIMWDDDDNLVLIDWGSVFMVNHKSMGPDILYGGHTGYMAPEWVKSLASDMFSAGKTMQYFMKEWNQHDDTIEALLNRMIATEWYLRPTADQILHHIEQKFNA